MDFDNNVFVKLELGKKESSSYREERKRRVMKMLGDWEFVNSKLSTDYFSYDPIKLNLLLEELAEQYYQNNLQRKSIKLKNRLNYSKVLTPFKRDNVKQSFVEYKKELTESAKESTSSKFSRNITNKTSVNPSSLPKGSTIIFKPVSNIMSDRESSLGLYNIRSRNEIGKIAYFGEDNNIFTSFCQKTMHLREDKLKLVNVIDKIISSKNVEDCKILRNNIVTRNMNNREIHSEDIRKKEELTKLIKTQDRDNAELTIFNNHIQRLHNEEINNKKKTFEEDGLDKQKQDFILGIVRSYHDNIKTLSRSNGYLLERSNINQRDCKTSFLRPKSNSLTKSMKKSFSGVNYFDDPNYRGNRLNIFSMEKKNAQEIENMIVKSCNKEMKKSERNILKYYRKSNGYIDKIGLCMKKGIEGKLEMKFMKNFRKEILKDKEKLNLLFSKHDNKLFVSKDKSKLSQEIISLKRILKK